MAAKKKTARQGIGTRSTRKKLTTFIRAEQGSMPRKSGNGKARQRHSQQVRQTSPIVRNDNGCPVRIAGASICRTSRRDSSREPGARLMRQQMRTNQVKQGGGKEEKREGLVHARVFVLEKDQHSRVKHSYTFVSHFFFRFFFFCRPPFSVLASPKAQ